MHLMWDPAGWKIIFAWNFVRAILAWREDFDTNLTFSTDLIFQQSMLLNFFLKRDFMLCIVSIFLSKLIANACIVAIWL